jgi:hypothetical protein
MISIANNDQNCESLLNKKDFLLEDLPEIELFKNLHALYGA